MISLEGRVMRPHRLPSGQAVYLSDDLAVVCYTVTVTCPVEDVPDLPLRREVLDLVGRMRGERDSHDH